MKQHKFNISQALQLATKHHQAGKLQEAERIYRQILNVEPDNADAYHLLGLIAHQVGKNEIAVRFISEALKRNPHQALFYFSLGNSLQSLGQFDLAVKNFHKALSIKPDFTEAHNNLGYVLFLQTTILFAYDLHVLYLQDLKDSFRM